MPKKWLWCSHSHGAMGVLILANISHHHESLDTHCPLDVSQECFEDFRKLVGIPDKWGEMKIKGGCLEEGDTYLLFCSSGGPSSFHSSASFCIYSLPPCSGLQGLCSKP